MISIAQYEEVLKTLSEGKKDILIQYYANAPFNDTNDIADVLGYPNSGSVNLQIGSLGAKISKQTGVIPLDRYDYKGGERISYYTLVHDNYEDGWDLVDNLQIAMENLGWVSNPEQNVIHLETEGDDERHLYREGKVTRVFVNKYERNPVSREACLQHYGFICQGCKIDFQAKYGSDTPLIIHVHHIKPLSEIQEETYTDFVHDLVPLCPNCHAVVHAFYPVLTLEELRGRVRQNAQG